MSITLENRWFQLVASLIAMIMIANLQYSWTLFVEPLRAANGWKLSEVSAAFTLFILFQTWVQPIDGWLIDRLGPRGFISAAGVLCAFGWAGLAYATTLPQLYTLYAIAGIGAAFVYSGSIGSALKWFRSRRGLASGIMAAGFGGGTALFIPIISSTIRSHGYQAAFLRTGLFQGVVILLVAQFLRHPAAEASDDARLQASRAKSPADGARASQAIHQLTTLEMLRTPRFYSFYAMFVLMATGGLLVTAQAGPMAKAWGISLGGLALATSLSPVANGASRIFWGWVSDRLGREATMAIAFLLQAISLLMVLTLGHLSSAWFAATLVLVYFTWGEIYSLFPSAAADSFGTRHATSNYSVLYTAKGVASIIGGFVAARLYERFGSWSACFYGSAVLALIAAVMAFALYARRTRPAESLAFRTAG
jgi:OFA family oxalate/formate antiporter-like MFS transporter